MTLVQSVLWNSLGLRDRASNPHPTTVVLLLPYFILYNSLHQYYLGCRASYVFPAVWWADTVPTELTRLLFMGLVRTDQSERSAERNLPQTDPTLIRPYK